ncbi:MAG TPA: hypothetical protein PLV68_07830, partial [Ilumatobacteraceae bacterium]|nr:hypothetical protein [Ilumatobacteraceae bacterium]
YVSEDPDASWATLAPHLLHVSNSYAKWMEDDQRTGSFVHADSVDELRAGEVFEIYTPDECAAKLREWGSITIDPLFGGIAPDVAWECLELIRDKVLPQLDDA